MTYINNKVLLYSIVNYSQYVVINYNRKEYEKEYILYISMCMYICNWITLLYTRN